MAELPNQPVTRQEMYLSRLAGENTTLPVEPLTREEMYLEGAIDRVEAVEEEVEEIKNNPDVVDIVDTYADLQAYDTSHLTDKDIIRVLTDETHSGNSTYYRFTKNPDTWTFIGEVSGGVNVVQATGTSTTDVMSQKAVTDMVFVNGSTNKVQIGSSASASITGNGSAIAIGTSARATEGNSTAIGTSATASGSNALSVGRDSVASSSNAVALGRQAKASGQNSIAIGWNATATQQGQFDISTGTNQTAGYNSSNYRLLTGLYDGQSAHDAATVAQGNTLATSAPTTATVGVLGQLYTDTTTMHTYQCTAIDTTDPNSPSYTWTQRW